MEVAIEKTEYTYYDNDKVNTMVDYKCENGNSVTYRYTKYEYDLFDVLCAMYEVNDTSNPTSEQLAKCKVSFEYNVEGNLKKISFSNNKDITALTYTYNTFNWPTEI